MGNGNRILREQIALVRTLLMAHCFHIDHIIYTDLSVNRNTVGSDGWIAVASSVSVFVVSSVFFFIIGFLCRHFAYVCGKRKPLSETVSPPEEKPTPLYDDVIPRQQEQELELNTNVAYGTTCTSIGAVQ